MRHDFESAHLSSELSNFQFLWMHIRRHRDEPFGCSCHTWFVVWWLVRVSCRACQQWFQVFEFCLRVSVHESGSKLNRHASEKGHRIASQSRHHYLINYISSPRVVGQASCWWIEMSSKFVCISAFSNVCLVCCSIPSNSLPLPFSHPAINIIQSTLFIIHWIIILSSVIVQLFVKWCDRPCWILNFRFVIFVHVD